MESAASEYAVMVGLERENQALRDLVLNMQRVLQSKDSEIAIKYHMLQAREKENTQARIRLAGLEAHAAHHPESAAPTSPNFAAAESQQVSESIIDRNLLLRMNSAAQTSETQKKPSELANLGCRGLNSEAMTPSRAIISRAHLDAKSPAPLVIDEEEGSATTAQSTKMQADAASATETPSSPSIPSKRLAIVDPSSGKQIEVECASNSRVKPTLIDIQELSDSSRPRFSGGGQTSQESPAATPLLQLPPVLAGAPPLPGNGPPLGTAPAHMPGFGHPGLPPPLLPPGVPPSLPPPGLVHGLRGLSGYPPHPGLVPGLSPLGSPLGVPPSSLPFRPP